MLLYLITKKTNELNSHIFFITIMKYIFVIALLKFIEHKHNMYGFFNIYISLVIIIDFGFTFYNYIQTHILNIPQQSINNLKKMNDEIINSEKSKNLLYTLSFKNLDFNTYPDEIINSNFDIKKFNNELKKFNESIKDPLNFESTKLTIQESLVSGQNKKKIKIIKKENETETEIKKFNENVLNK